MRGPRGRSWVVALLVLVLVPALLSARAAAALPPPPQDAAPPAAKPAAATKLEGVGETPPALEEVEWIQGKALKQYKRGEVYVVCFASTALGRTLPRLLRELVALQAEHAKDRVQVVGLFVAPDPRAEPPMAYMKRRPEAAGLLVGRDKGDATFAAFRNLIGEVEPETAVVIDKKGRIAWHGKVLTDLGPAVAAAVTDDAAALGKLVEGRQSIQEAAKPQIEALNKAGKTRQWDKVVAAVDALVALDPKLYADAGLFKYQALVTAGKKPEAAAYGRELVAGPLHDDEGQLNELAWWIVDPAGRIADPARDLELALAAAERGCELGNQQDAAMLDTLARVHWRLGHRDQAIELQKKSLSLAFGAEFRTVIQKSLDEYLAPPKPKPDAAAAEPAPGAPAVPPPPPGADPPAGTPPPPPPGGEEPKH